MSGRMGRIVQVCAVVVVASAGGWALAHRTDDRRPARAADVQLAAPVAIPDVRAEVGVAVAPPLPAAHAADPPVELPARPDDAEGTMAYARAVAAAQSHASRTGRRPVIRLTARARAALAELEALRRDQAVQWEDQDTEPIEREQTGEAPDPLSVLRDELGTAAAAAVLARQS